MIDNHNEQNNEYSIPFALNVCSVLLKHHRILNKGFITLQMQYWNFSPMDIEIYISSVSKPICFSSFYKYKFLKKNFVENPQIKFFPKKSTQIIHRRKKSAFNSFQKQA